MMHKFDPTTPDGRQLLSVNFSRVLPVGATLVGIDVTCEVHEDSATPDATPASRLDGTAFIQGDVGSQWFRNGVAGVDYVLTFLGTFSDTEIEPVQASISVRQFT